MLSARRKALLNSLFEMWDNDGSGFLDLDEVETVMKKYKDGVEMDAIAKGLYSNASPYLRCAGAGERGASGFMDCSNIYPHKRSLGQSNIFTPVCDSVHRDGGLLPGGVSGGDPPDGYCCGRYASYWNAFLFCPKFSIWASKLKINLCESKIYSSRTSGQVSRY